jgi:hypothetical protein
MRPETDFFRVRRRRVWCGWKRIFRGHEISPVLEQFSAHRGTGKTGLRGHTPWPLKRRRKSGANPGSGSPAPMKAEIRLEPEERDGAGMKEHRCDRVAPGWHWLQEGRVLKPVPAIQQGIKERRS